MKYNEHTAAAKAKRLAATQAELDQKQTRRNLANKRIELAHEEVKAAYEHRAKLMDEDAASGLTVRAMAPLYGIHWTGIQKALRREHD